MVTGTGLEVEAVRAIAASVVDPEIPVLTIEDLGVLRDVTMNQTGAVTVVITPTYSGCPAMRQIEDDIVSAYSARGIAAAVEVRHHPTWTTEWIGPEARQKLDEFGIAPPGPPEEILCPACRSAEPRLIARFGSTACKALMVCSSCGEPFDYFKEF